MPGDDHYADWECRDLQFMYQNFEFPIGNLTTKDLIDRAEHIKEELEELFRAIRNGDTVEIADALVDIVVVAKGTAVMMQLPWDQLWKEVHRANSTKERGINPKRPDHGHDLIKPDGWIPPRISEVLDGSL